MSQCEYAKVVSVSAGVCDRGILTADVSLHLGRTGSSYQGFGGLTLTPASEVLWKQELAAVFNVADYESIVGCECFVLRSWGNYGAKIEGIASIDGRRRFTIAGFQKKHFPEVYKDRLEYERDNIKASIQSLHRQLERENMRLNTLQDGYIDWTVAPIKEVKETR